MTEIKEAISLESDLLLKLNPLSEAEIFEFMKNLRGGTYFNMGMYSSIPVSKAYKSTIRIYKVIDLTAIVSGVSYENIGTTKDFRQHTGETPGKAWYDHTPGYENKIAQKKSDPNSKYVLWDIKRGTGTCVRYYVVDIETGAVTPVSKTDVENSPYLTATEKAKLTPKPVVGFDLATGEAVENKTNWRTAAFDHIFWLNQAGKSTQEYGIRFEEGFGLTEALGDDIFIDAHAHVRTDLDAILSGEVTESLTEATNDTPIVFIDATGSASYTKELEAAAVADGFKNNEEWQYITDSMFSDVLAAAEQGNNVYFYTADDDYKFNCKELADFANVKIINVLEDLEEAAEADVFMDAHAGVKTKLDDILSGAVVESRDAEETCETDCGKEDLKESYRRIISRGNTLVDNELFIDFD